MTDAPTPRCSSGSAEALQQRGHHYDIIQEALATYDEWLLDDDFNATRALQIIIDRMRERVEMTDPPAGDRQVALDGEGKPVYYTRGVAQGQSGCGEEDIAIALFEARNHGLTNILPWDDIEHDGRDYWRAVARGLMRTHQVSSVSSTDQGGK